MNETLVLSLEGVETVEGDWEAQKYMAIPCSVSLTDISYNGIQFGGATGLAFALPDHPPIRKVQVQRLMQVQAQPIDISAANANLL